jgi:uncharacterized DUF497 family protein
MFDWSESNIAHIARHNVAPHEAEEVILNDPIDLSFEMRNGEERTEQIGETKAGRILRVVTTLRGNKVRVVTAIPLKSRWHAWYFALKEQQNAGHKSSS